VLYQNPRIWKYSINTVGWKKVRGNVKRCEYLKGNNLPPKMVIKGKYFPFWVQGSGVQGSGFKVQGSRFRGSGFRVSEG